MRQATGGEYKQWRRHFISDQYKGVKHYWCGNDSCCQLYTSIVDKCYYCCWFKQPSQLLHICYCYHLSFLVMVVQLFLLLILNLCLQARMNDMTSADMDVELQILQEMNKLKAKGYKTPPFRYVKAHQDHTKPYHCLSREYLPGKVFSDAACTIWYI